MSGIVEEKRKIKNFKDLDVWKLGKEIVKATYQLTGMLPEKEQYGLIAQMRRAAISIPCNVSEGFNRYHNKEYRQFLYVALGSCAELETQIELCVDLGYVSMSIVEDLLEKLDHETRMLRNLIKKLESRSV